MSKNFLFCKTCRNFSESCVNQILRPDSERTRSQLPESGLRIVLTTLSQKLEIFAKKRSFFLSNPFFMCVGVCVCVCKGVGCVCGCGVSETVKFSCDLLVGCYSLRDATNRFCSTPSLPSHSIRRILPKKTRG